MNAEFSERLRKFRDSLGLSQDKLAQKTGIFQTTLNSYEHATEGKDLRIPLHFLQGLASLGCDLHWLMTGSPAPSTKEARDEMADKISALYGQVEVLQATIRQMGADHTAAIERILIDVRRREK